MKHIIKMTFYLLTIISMFVISSCQKDLYDDEVYQSKIKLESISLKNLKSGVKINNNLYSAVDKIKKLKDRKSVV